MISHLFFEEKNEFNRTNLKLRWDQLILVEEGSFVYQVEGEDEQKCVGKGEIVFFSAGTAMERHVTSRISSYHMSFIGQADHPFRLAMQTGVLKLPSAQTASIFNSMKRAMLMPQNRELLEHLIAHVLSEQYLYGKNDRVSSRPLSEEVLSTIRYMNVHLNEKIDVDALADRVYLSHTGLIWKFRQELNTTPSQYLILLRLRYAKQLLLDHDYSITEIAELCGYQNPYYFTNVFHQYTGKSPTEFRRFYAERQENS